MRREGEEKIVLKGLSSATRTGAPRAGEEKERGGSSSSSHGAPQPNALKLLEKELREKRRKAELSKERSMRGEDEEEDGRSRDRYDNGLDQRRKRGRDSSDRSLSSSQKSQRVSFLKRRTLLHLFIQSLHTTRALLSFLSVVSIFLS